MSLLTACQAAVNVTGLGTAPSTIIGNTNPLAIQLNYLAERVAKSLRVKPWQAMIREHTITTAAGTERFSGVLSGFGAAGLYANLSGASLLASGDAAEARIAFIVGSTSYELSIPIEKQYA